MASATPSQHMRHDCGYQPQTLGNAQPHRRSKSRETVACNRDHHPGALREGDSIQVFCRSLDKWVKGLIVKLEEGNHVRVEYEDGENRCAKWLRLNSDHLRIPPATIQDSVSQNGKRSGISRGTLAEEASKAAAIHSIGSGTKPAKPELYEEFCRRAETKQTILEIQNRFYSGFGHAEIDWAQPVHGIVVDFKGDGMQLGMILERLSECNEQYVFIGNPLPFNGGWHFTAVNDFEHPREQRSLDPSWKNIRIWHRVNYVPTQTETGAPALTPREDYNAENRSKGAIPITDDFKLSTIILVGGLMPGTLNATIMADGGPAAMVLARHLELSEVQVATVGHGLDVLIALGSRERSLVAGYMAAEFPYWRHLLRINDLMVTRRKVCTHLTPGRAKLVSASYWGQETKEPFFKALGLVSSGGSSAGSERLHIMQSSEAVFCFDASKLPGLEGASCVGEDAAAPTVAVFVDEAADPVELYEIIAELLRQKFTFHLISGSTDRDDYYREHRRREYHVESSFDDMRSHVSHRVDRHGHYCRLRTVTTETVFGNAMYPLKDCFLLVPTTPANLVDRSIKFDGFFVPGGQSPYFLLDDWAVTRLMNAAPVAAAVGHGPEALVGSKWLHPSGGEAEPWSEGKFTSYYGAWTSFRDVITRYEKKKPGEICIDSSGRLFTGNAPASAKEMTSAACSAMRFVKSAS
eukprot:TRINITY_DN3862_c0_g1_i4.p1 TRINITY_DN3862_c0_g1~~TRINITY_DN3862_c0_g1_i4.p1  ORF type:complete len:693 (+),score=125.83 TRINITY_DN3862_c0_g1_i4:63-2141(+)